jgi:hypothetical protein
VIESLNSDRGRWSDKSLGLSSSVQLRFTSHHLTFSLSGVGSAKLSQLDQRSALTALTERAIRVFGALRMKDVIVKRMVHFRFDFWRLNLEHGTVQNEWFSHSFSRLTSIL